MAAGHTGEDGLQPANCPSSLPHLLSFLTPWFVSFGDEVCVGSAFSLAELRGANVFYSLMLSLVHWSKLAPFFTFLTFTPSFHLFLTLTAIYKMASLPKIKAFIVVTANDFLLRTYSSSFSQRLWEQTPPESAVPPSQSQTPLKAKHENAHKWAPSFRGLEFYQVICWKEHIK